MFNGFFINVGLTILFTAKLFKLLKELFKKLSKAKLFKDFFILFIYKSFKGAV